MRIISISVSSKKLIIIKGSDYSLRTGQNEATRCRSFQFANFR